MIEDYIVKTTWNNANKKHLVNKGYKFTKLGDEVYIRSIDIQETSPIKVKFKCDKCGNVAYRQRRQMKFLTYCSSCSGKLRAKLCKCGKQLKRPGKYDKCSDCRVTQFTRNDYEVLDDKIAKINLRNSHGEVNGFTFIDLEDLERVIKYKWRITTGNYIVGGEDNVTRLHRFLLNCPSESEVDHINRIVVDNRKSNLRIVDRKTNCNNRRSSKDMRYAELKYNDIANGEGIRMSFWTQGCDIRCAECHNNSIWDFNGGKTYNGNVIKEIRDNMMKNGIKRDFSILGGEPLHIKNIDVTLDVLINVRRFFPSSNIWLWTGYNYEDLNNDKVKIALHYIDVIVDGRFDINKRDIRLKFRGSSNQRIIDVKASLSQNKTINIGVNYELPTNI